MSAPRPETIGGGYKAVIGGKRDGTPGAARGEIATTRPAGS